LEEFFIPGERLYLAIDRTSWECINIFDGEPDSSSLGLADMLDVS